MKIKPKLKDSSTMLHLVSRGYYRPGEVKKILITQIFNLELNNRYAGRKRIMLQALLNEYPELEMF